MSDISFDPEALIEEAKANTGLSDFGDEAFREALDMLCKTYDQNPWDEKGRKKNRRRVLGLLQTRLRCQETYEQHPEIAERPLPKPMVLTGMPRSGTSALFNLLAADPAARALLLWETQFPDPAVGLAPGQEDPRYLAVKNYYDKLHAESPDFSKIHYMSADTPEECVLLHAYSLSGVHHGVECLLEPYRSWYMGQDLDRVYREYRLLLQLLDWQRPGERWLVKTPAHMWAIDSLIEHFPDVSIVWSHRDPLLCTASICSMTAALMEGLDIEKTALGPVVMDFYATSLERGLDTRDRCEAARFVDVSHDGFVADSMSTVREIYDHFDMEMGPVAERALQAHVDSHPKDKHGKHEYSLEEFGLTPEVVRERFADYIARFGLA